MKLDKRTAEVCSGYNARDVTVSPGKFPPSLPTSSRPENTVILNRSWLSLTENAVFIQTEVYFLDAREL